MLEPIMHILNEKKIVLASGAKTRQEFLRNIGVNAECCPSRFEENLDPKSFNSFSEFVEETALQKVLEVERRLTKEGQAPDVVIGADTMVTVDNQMFGKPANPEEAVKMLKRLSGKSNVVLTGVAVKARGQEPRKFTEKTEVFFDEMTEEQIRAYVNTKEPLDKAGSYAIQGRGGTFVTRISGDYSAVIGLPLNRLCAVLYDLYHE
ncbi:hypothetical protein ABMA27_013637 [Loxostege sticticalis]|uniref:Maf protein n=1 Tax=Loxostege sticticalis TaxID=481309 RepID=A0ABR3IG20_LOXSC